MISTSTLFVVNVRISLSLWLSNIASCVYTISRLSKHLLMYTYADSVPLLLWAAMNMGEQVSFSYADFIFFGYITRNGIAGSCNRSIFSLLWLYLPTVLGCPFLYTLASIGPFFLILIDSHLNWSKVMPVFGFELDYWERLGDMDVWALLQDTVSSFSYLFFSERAPHWGFLLAPSSIKVERVKIHFWKLSSSGHGTHSMEILPH